MGDINLKYTAKTNITITLNSKGNGVYQEGTAVDNGTALFIDALLGGKLTVGTTPTAGSSFDIFLAASTDGGTTYGGGDSGSLGTTGADGVWAGEVKNIKFVESVVIPAATTDIAYEFSGISVAAAFRGILPDMWTVIILNATGVTTNASAGNFEVHYQGVEATVA